MLGDGRDGLDGEDGEDGRDGLDGVDGGVRETVGSWGGSVKRLLTGGVKVLRVKVVGDFSSHFIKWSLWACSMMER